jgi:hypothetical protein
MASAGEIERFHYSLSDCIRELTAMRAAVQSSQEGWRRVQKGGRVVFDLLDPNHTAFAERRRGGRCPVFSVERNSEPLEDQAWAAWHEEWYCAQRNDFDLIGVGWTFFWGIEGRLGPDQEILRAEWDQVPETESQSHRRGGNAAQPHWHLDTGLMVGYTRPISPAIRTAASGELEEVAPDVGSALIEIGRPTGIQELSLSGMHLGMGGWRNHGDHPRCWQMPIDHDWRGPIVLWAEQTLRLARDQFRCARVTDITN